MTTSGSCIISRSGILEGIEIDGTQVQVVSRDNEHISREEVQRLARSQRTIYLSYSQLNEQSPTYILELSKRNLAKRSGKIEGLDNFGIPLFHSPFARLYLVFYRQHINPHNQFANFTPWQENGKEKSAICADNVMQLAEDLCMPECKSGQRGYEKGNKRRNQYLKLKNVLANFGVKIRRTDANGNVLTTQPHHESHFHYFIHELFVVVDGGHCPKHFDKVRNEFSKGLVKVVLRGQSEMGVVVDGCPKHFDKVRNEFSKGGSQKGG